MYLIFIVSHFNIQTLKNRCIEGSYVIAMLVVGAT